MSTCLTDVCFLISCFVVKRSYYVACVLCTPLCKSDNLYTAHSSTHVILYTVFSTVNTENCTMYTVHCTM